MKRNKRSLRLKEGPRAPRVALTSCVADILDMRENNYDIISEKRTLLLKICLKIYVRCLSQNSTKQF